MLAPALVLLSDLDTDAPVVLPGIATVSKDRDKAGWDHGAWELGLAAARRGALWVDRPFHEGLPPVAWMVDQCRAITAAGGYCQLGNEPDQDVEQVPGATPEAKVDAYCRRAAECVAAYPEGNWLAPPIGDPTNRDRWRALVTRLAYTTLVRTIGRVAIHAYGSLAQMTETVQWYLDAFPDVDLFDTETNPGAGNTFDLDVWAKDQFRPFLDWCAGHERIRIVAYFALAWDRSPRLPSSIDARGTRIEAELAAFVARQWAASHVAAGVGGGPGHGENGGQAASGDDVPVTPQPAAISLGGMPVATIKGLDCSNHQGEIDWFAVAASGIAFAIAKASGDEGGGVNRFLDPYFVANWRGMASTPLVRGCYHYARPSVATPEASVALLAEALDAAGGLAPGDLVALDLEDPAVPVGTTLAPWAARWLELAAERFGVLPLLYTGDYYMREHGLYADAGLGAALGLGRYPLWLASYQETRPPTPPGWDRIAVWQHSASGRVPGVAGDCDTNVFDGSADELRALSAPAAPAFDVDAERDALWGSKDRLAANGWPRFAQAIEAAVTQSKGER